MIYELSLSFSRSPFATYCDRAGPRIVDRADRGSRTCKILSYLEEVSRTTVGQDKHNWSEYYQRCLEDQNLLEDLLPKLALARGRQIIFHESNLTISHESNYKTITLMISDKTWSLQIISQILKWHQNNISH
jgi:hypothetical protein